MNDTIYDIGDVAHLEVTFRDLDGDPTDQTSITLTVRDPDGEEADYTPSHDGTGIYSYDLDINLSGNWIGTWQGDTDAIPIGFWVRPDALASTSPVYYISPGRLKQILGVQNTDFADEALELACDTASRVIERYKGTRYYPTAAQTRYYTSDPHDRWIEIDDLSAFTSLTLDTDDDGDYETTWTQNTDFRLEPVNAPTDGQPWNRLVVKGCNRFPIGEAAIKLTGTFGWASTPPEVEQAASLLANRFLKRNREAPFDVLTVIANESVAVAHLGSLDKDVKFILDQLPGAPALRSFQLT